MKYFTLIAVLLALCLSSCRETEGEINVNVEVDGEGRDIEIGADDNATLGKDQQENPFKEGNSGVTAVADSVAVDTTRIKIERK